MRERFWEQFPLEALESDEWEALCDGCGRCCLLKLEDEDTEKLHFTAVACGFLNLETSRCRVYADRLRRQPGCVSVTPSLVRESAQWLPPTCAYRLVAEGKPLYAWHPLLTGDAESTRFAGVSVVGKVISEVNVPEEALQDHLIRWVD